MHEVTQIQIHLADQNPAYVLREDLHTLRVFSNSGGNLDYHEIQLHDLGSYLAMHPGVMMLEFEKELADPPEAEAEVWKQSETAESVTGRISIFTRHITSIDEYTVEVVR